MLLYRNDPHGVLNNFTNHEFDEILGLYFAKARFYCPVDRRFTQVDPVKSGVNWYAYVYNNPLKYVDPLGLFGVINPGTTPNSDPLFDEFRNLERRGSLITGPRANFLWGMQSASLEFQMNRIESLQYVHPVHQAIKQVADLYQAVDTLTSALSMLGRLVDAGFLTEDEAREFLGAQMTLHVLSPFGDMVNLYNHREYFSRFECLKDEQAFELGRMTFRAAEELLNNSVSFAALKYGVQALAAQKMAAVAARATHSNSNAAANQVLKSSSNATTNNAGFIGPQVNSALVKPGGAVPQLTGWRVGRPINVPTAQGNYPAWSTVQSRYWKNEAFYRPNRFAPDDLVRAQGGNAPLHPVYGVSRELHHIGGRGGIDPHRIGNLVEVWPWEHAVIDRSRHYTGPGPVR